MIGGNPQTIATSSAREATRQAIEEILGTIGAENVRLWLPMWETTGSTSRDLLRRDGTFTHYFAPTKAQLGLLHPVPAFVAASTQYLRQDPLTGATAGAGDYVLSTGTFRSAQLLPALTGTLGWVTLKVKRVGALASATVRAHIYADDGGAPNLPTGAGITSGSSTAMLCSAIDTSYGYYGFAFPTAPALGKASRYWLALEYVDSTAVDGAHYIAWQYDAAGGYAQGRATFDGAAWNDAPGTDHAFEVWTDELQLSGDYSVIVVASNAKWRCFVSWL